MYRFILMGVIIGANLFTTPVWGASLVRQASVFIAAWEHPQLSQGEVEYVNGYFPGADPLKSAEACDARATCLEGVVVGFGYSLGGHSREDLRRDLTPIVGRERVERMMHCVGLRGMAAYNACHNSKDLRVSREEAFRILEIGRVPKDVAAVEAKASEEGVALTPNQVVGLASLRYTNNSLVDRAPNLWAALRKGDAKAVAYEIRSNSGTQYAPGLARRREFEAMMVLTNMRM